MHATVVIPARYASTRLPGKPLISIAGQTMLERVVRIAYSAIEGFKNVSVLVATDDERILNHCKTLAVNAVMTSKELASGTDRAAAAVAQLSSKPDFILNLQGDAPLTPPDFLRALLKTFIEKPCDAITPVVQLNWAELDALREQKKKTPFSGTTVTFNSQTGEAYWFSKTILPALRNEKKLRQEQTKSPVYRHIGLYGYSYSMLERFICLPESHYEQLEGLEQLRLLEHGYTIRCVPVEYGARANMSGVDSPEDVLRAEALIAKHGELL